MTGILKAETVTNMKSGAEELARQFEDANQQLMALVESLDDKQWQAGCNLEGWSVGQAVCHIAEDHVVLASFVRLIANGEALPHFTAEEVHQINAEQSGRNAGCAKEDVLQLLHTNGASVVAMLRGMTDAQLGSVVSIPETHAFRVMDDLPELFSASFAIEVGLIGHFREHGPSILSAIYPGLFQGGTHNGPN